MFLFLLCFRLAQFGFQGLLYDTDYNQSSSLYFTKAALGNQKLNLFLQIKMVWCKATNNKHHLLFLPLKLGCKNNKDKFCLSFTMSQGGLVWQYKWDFEICFTVNMYFLGQEAHMELEQVRNVMDIGTCSKRLYKFTKLCFEFLDGSHH